MSDLVSPELGYRPERPLNIMLIDDDPIFRMGLRAVIQQYTDLQVVAEAESKSDAREILESGQTVDLIILDASLGRLLPQGSSSLELCQQLKVQYPQLPILLLSSSLQPVVLEAARQVGVEGFCPKGIAVSELIDAIRQVGAGETFWTLDSGERMQQRVQNLEDVSDSKVENKAGFFIVLLNRMALSGVRQIEAALAEVTQELQNSRLSVLDRAILAGRRRELLAALGLVNKLFAPGVTTELTPNDREQASTVAEQQGNSGERVNSDSKLRSDSALTRRETTLPSGRSPLLENTFAKIQYSLQNLSGVPQEIDIFREEKKRELLNVVLRKFEEILDELRFSQVQQSQLLEKRFIILQDLWESATTEFFGKYYTLRGRERELEVVNTILQDAEVVRSEILVKIPFVVELFSYLLFETPLMIDNAYYTYGTPEAMARAELLLQNLLIQEANAVVQPLLNRLGDVEIIKQKFYDKQVISSRDIERFRNDLSWKYRQERYVGEPKAIFESRYNLFYLDGFGIAKVSIYAPRGDELEKLSGIQYAFTLMLETRDAIAPRLRSVVAFMGRGVVYVLTQVIGRGIGLIARGILQGIGNSLDDTKFGKNSQRGK